MSWVTGQEGAPIGCRSHELDPAAGQGSCSRGCFLQEVVPSLGAVLFHSKPLSQSPAEFCRRVNSSRSCPVSWFSWLVCKGRGWTGGEGGEVKRCALSPRR